MLKWYLNRLMAMNYNEFIYRCVQFFQKRNFFFYNKNGKNTYKSVFYLSNTINTNKLQINNLSLQLTNFAGSWNMLTDDIDWHLDRVSALSFEIKPYYKINIRANRIISAKNVWEINRMHILIPLALQYNESENEEYLDRIIFLISNWEKENPYLYGINWYSNIEVNIRLINFYYLWEILNAESLMQNNKIFADFVNDTWIPLIYKHNKYCINHLSFYSSANNHLVSEYTGLFVSNSKWKFPESNKWLKIAQEGLEVEIEKQHSNGVNKEEASEYIQFITDLFFLPYLVAEHTKNNFSAKYLNILREIFDYIFYFRDANGHIPRYGDDDDGHVLWQELSYDKNNFSSLMISAAILFDDQKYIQKIENTDLKNQIIFNNVNRQLFEIKGKTPLMVSKFYPVEGHYFFKKQKSENKEIYLHFNAAPLGYLSIAAHGHSDALSFEMNVNGFPVFIDPGTYCYHVDPEWRNYFVSSKAHNTITINNENQAKRSGDTMWHKHFTCRTNEIIQSENIESVSASHNGYDKLIHQRKIDFDKEKDEFMVSDEIVNNGNSEYSIFFPLHIHKDITIELINKNELYLKHDSGIKLSVIFDSGENFDELKIDSGKLNPIMGWNSPSFLVKESSQVVWFSYIKKETFKNSLKIKIYEY